MSLHAASREALAGAEQRLDSVLAGKKADPATVGDQLLSVVALLDGEIGLRRAVADASADPEARQRLVRSLLGAQLSEPALQVLDSVAGGRWSSPRELVDGLESLGRSALLTSAERAGTLDTVEDELFRVSRIVAANAGLDQALSDQVAGQQAKRTLIRDLFSGKVDDITLKLTEQVVDRSKGRGVGYGIDQLVRLTGQRRERSIAHVRTATELTAAHQEQLADMLRGIYGRQVALHIEVDPSVGGGLVIRVGDEVIDGSVSGQLSALRRQFAH